MSDLRALSEGELEVTGRLVAASNGTFVGQVVQGSLATECVYKPVRGERPLWDFPDGTLAAREYAAYLVSEAAGWHVVPPTVLRDGPFGVGMVQEWVDVDVDAPQVAVVPADETPDGWFAVVDAVDLDDRPVTLLHRDTPDLRTVALFDAVVNNADRKGGHLLPSDGRVRGCDHGLTFHEEPKLRTVLWGWSGDVLEPGERSRLETLRADVTSGPLCDALADLLAVDERRALTRRIDQLLTSGRMPDPGDRWPTIPWPPL
ncbi:SCO1664 family protein [Mumia sp. zg.B21]|uniref:SCO1664 family protein n=1 Tax=Mumia sp. zg.B21 TaxID=2855447 RepID=UPI001C6E0ED2|nr:SCO1664 family protein [Mumia sp. zg.B21]MBW9208892.1 SCO1664 family protein [Mumia sp. zg.B21]